MSRRLSPAGLVAGGLLVALALVFLVAPHASSAPDGLEKVAANHHLDAANGTSPTSTPRLAGTTRSVGGASHRTSLAGAAGVAITFAVVLVVSKLLTIRRARERTGALDSPHNP